MKTGIICFSLRGCETAEQIKLALEAQGHEIRLAKKSKYIQDAEPVNVDDWTREQFGWADHIIFVGACGIAVRHIAPYIRSKKQDPAVLAVDECGTFVISLLSGHLGGANELTHQVAGLLGAIPVVTTATDLHNCFAVDVFARKNNCEILNMQAAKAVSAALLAGKKVGFYSEFSWDGALPNGLVLCSADGVPSEQSDEAMCTSDSEASEQPDEAICTSDSEASEQIRENTGSAYELGIAVTVHRDCKPFPSTVTIVPPVFVLGMGCRKGKEAAVIREAAAEAVKQNGLYLQSISKLTSIDLKKEEQGILALSEAWKLPFETYSEAELKEVQGEFSSSMFVQSITGVDNVCERSAVCGSKGGKLIQKKNGRDGVTTALAQKEWRMRFE